jgi:LysR family transcriptional activator of nhaA
MEWLNYHHLLYFWFVAREGGLAPAGKILRLSHSTLSAQVHELEDQLGEKLFTKVGRKLALTDVGHVVFRYADEIFKLGREMVDTVKDRSPGGPVRVEVGVVDVVPKLVVQRLLQPALALGRSVRLVCHEAPYEKLLADLAIHELDVVIADAPVPEGTSVRAFTHDLGSTGISFFGTRALAQKLRRGFPKSLHGAPMLLPLENLATRRSLNQWFDLVEVRPQIVAEFEDSALLTTFGADGVGVFPAPSIVENELVAQLGVEKIGDADEVSQRFYAVSVERRLKNPAAVAIQQAARHTIFTAAPNPVR